MLSLILTQELLIIQLQWVMVLTILYFQQVMVDMFVLGHMCMSLYRLFGLGKALLLVVLHVEFLYLMFHKVNGIPFTLDMWSVLLGLVNWALPLDLAMHMYF